MIYKRCSHCGKQLPVSKKCECQIVLRNKQNKERNKRYDKLKRDKESAEFYNSTKWKKLRDHVKNFYNGIDIYLYYKYNKLEYGHTVHHIVPIKDDKTKRLSLSNLILLTERSHQEIHKRMDSGNMEEVIKELNDYRLKFISDFKR